MRTWQDKDKGRPKAAFLAMARWPGGAMASLGGGNYSTVTDFARLRGLSTSVPRAQAV